MSRLVPIEDAIREAEVKLDFAWRARWRKPTKNEFVAAHVSALKRLYDLTDLRASGQTHIEMEG